MCSFESSEIIIQGQEGARAVVGTEKLNKALLIACLLGDASQAEILLNLGADPNVENGHALYTSATEGDERIVQALIRAGVSKQCKWWSVSKDAAARLGHQAIVTLMDNPN